MKQFSARRFVLVNKKVAFNGYEISALWSARKPLFCFFLGLRGQTKSMTRNKLARKMPRKEEVRRTIRRQAERGKSEAFASQDTAGLNATQGVLQNHTVNATMEKHTI